MRNIAVICALPPERNTGMATVDLSAYTNIRRILPNDEITLYTYGKPNRFSYQPGELPFGYIDLRDHKEKFLKSDLFIYWGDFVHSFSYWRYDKNDWDTESHSRDEYRTYSEYMFLTEFSKEQLNKAIVFGSTIITNDAEDEIDVRYNQNYERFFSYAGAVFFRDALSAAKISPLKKEAPTLACDCALLLKKEDLHRLNRYTEASTKKDVGIFLGRSPSKYRMLLFMKLVAKLSARNVKWIPWFQSRRKFIYPAKLLGIHIDQNIKSPGELLSMVSGCEFIITDTYHLCVNAWQMGIPAICIGEGTGSPLDSLSDKKKEIFYEMYGARQFYVFLENICNFRGFFYEARRITLLLKKNEIIERVITNITAHSSTAIYRLENAVNKILSDNK